MCFPESHHKNVIDAADMVSRERQACPALPTPPRCVRYSLTAQPGLHKIEAVPSPVRAEESPDMHTVRTILSILFLLLAGSLLAQSTNPAGQKDPKAELQAKISHAHEMVTLYLYLYTRDTGTDRHYRAYQYW